MRGEKQKNSVFHCVLCGENDNPLRTRIFTLEKLRSKQLSEMFFIVNML